MKLLTLLAVLFLVGCGGGSSTNTPSPSDNPITVVQSASAVAGCTSTSGCSESLTLPNPVANGDFVAVVLSMGQTNPAATSVVVTDSQNNRYTNVSPNNNFAWAGNTLAYGFYASNVAGGSNFTVTASVSDTTSNKGFGGAITVVEAKNATAFDQWVAGNNCTNSQGCTLFSTNPFQEAHVDTLLIGFGSLRPPSGCQGACLSGVSLEPGPGFTMIGDVAEYLVITTGGQYNGIFMASSAANDAQVFFAFQ